MTIKLCVIDDIRTVVRGITEKIDWAQHGITIVGTATDGTEGLELIRRTQPEIVLTDIRMPFMDGITMMKQIEQELPGVKLIFLSGYTDFSYAQEAVRLGAFDYIVKPFSKDQVLQAVLKAKAALELERYQSAKMVEMEQKLRESMPFLRQEYMKLLVRYGSSEGKLRQQWEFFQIDMDKQDFCVMIAEIDFFTQRTEMLPVSEVELIRFAVHNILEETITTQTKGIIFRENVNQFVAVFNPPVNMEAEQLAELCREHVETYTNLRVSIGLGAAVKEFNRLSVSYGQAMAALSYHFYTGGNGVFRYAEERLGAAMPQHSNELEKELLYCLQSANTVKAEEQLDAIWEYWTQSSTPPEPEIIKSLSYELANSMHKVFIEKVNPEGREALESQLAEMKLKNSIFFKEMKEQIKEFCRLGCSYVQKRQYHDARSLVDQAIVFIEHNLDRNLTVGDCAKSVYLSPSYFSNLFKKEVGLTLAQYIITKRMDKAKEMLLGGMQVQDVALAVGYEDRPYFSELFKRHTGMTPSEFKAHYIAP